MQSCRLCNFPENEILIATKLSKAFFPKEPAATGHIVIAVKSHKPALQDLTEAEARDLFALARKVALITVPFLGLEKYYLAAVGDVDVNFHIHLLPKKDGDAKIGPYIFGPAGWQSKLAGKADPALLAKIKSSLKTLNKNGG